MGRGADKFDVTAFGLRIPTDLHAHITSHAKANRRSINNEIVTTLTAKYPAPAFIDVNGNLLSAVETIVGSWESMLLAIGQIPENNEAFSTAKEAIAAALTAQKAGE